MVQVSTVDECRTAQVLFICPDTSHVRLCAYHAQVAREESREPGVRAGTLTPGALCDECFARLYDD